MIIDNGVPAEIKIDDIAEDEFFKISKKNYHNTLPGSLKQSGMLEVPYVYKKDNSYTSLTCHNRIKLLRESGIKSIRCYVLEQPDAEIFMNYASLKTYRNELGPMGKLKTLTLINSFFNLDASLRKEFCTKTLKLNSEIIENEAYLKSVMHFPDNLADYIDEKDMSFKVIKDLSLLPSEWISIIDNWIKNTQVRVNIFRMLVDYVFDIYRRGDSVTVIESVSCSDDKALYDSIYRIRYPEYSRLKMRSESLISELSGSGVTIEFPEYFDRRSVTLKIDIDKNSDCAGQLKRVTKISVEKLTELLSLL